MKRSSQSPVGLGRRAFLVNGVLILASPAVNAFGAATRQADSSVRVGLVTDLHYADKPSAGTRHYREIITKLNEAAQQWDKDRPAFVVELGDFIDAADSVDVELGYLKTINRQFAAVHKDRHYVLGNHCVDTLTKSEFLDTVEQPKSYYSFDRGPAHFVVLDACFRSDGQPYGRKNSQWTDANIPPEELEWLEADLKTTQKPTIVFAHQRLDVSNSHGVKNAPQVRSVLEAAGNVRAVFQGHSHANDLKTIQDIHYCTLVAMVEGSGTENSGYSIMDVMSDGTIQLTGFRKQATHRWDPVSR
jgi:alkaline phosphatase